MFGINAYGSGRLCAALSRVKESMCWIVRIALMTTVLVAGCTVPREERIELEKPIEKPEGPPVLVPHYAMWVWRTGAYRKNPELWDELIAFAQSQGIGELFLQVNTVWNNTTGKHTVAEPGKIRAFIKQAGEAGIRVQALDGAPHFALEGRHDHVLAMVDAVLEFNAQSAPESRYVGVRMDVEPYLTDEWKRGGQDAVMRQWLEMNVKIMERIRAQDPDLAYGIDIPFWLDSTEDDGSLRYALEFRGVHQDLSRHFIDLVDHIGIMAYRERGTGPNSVISVSEGELKYASATGGARIYIGVETLPPDPPGVPSSITFGDQDPGYMRAELVEVIESARKHSAFTGIAIHHYESFRDLMGSVTISE